MSAISWVPVSLIGLFWAFGTARLLVGLASAKRQCAEQKDYAEVYGSRLAEHHGSKLSCAEAIAPLRERNRALEARITELEKKLIAVGHAAFKVPGAES